MKKGTIILLNGVSSSGKSTLAKELVASLDGYFHLSLDDFDQLIEKMETRGTDHLIPVSTETFFHRTAAMFSNQGIHLIVDHVLHDEETTRDCLDVLIDHPVCFVGVHCPLEELEQRERMRGDRMIGQARAQLAYVHRTATYDVEVDTHAGGASEQIIRRIREGKFTGLRETSDTFNLRA